MAKIEKIQPISTPAIKAVPGQEFGTPGGFVRDESGSLTILALFMFLMIVLVGGIGIDLMHNELKRTKLQGTLDAAILAAADLEQELAPADVVQDYFNKRGLGEYLQSVTVEDAGNYRRVSATAERSTPTMFMQMVGLDELAAPAAGTAEERVANVEISLILDISGSMGWNNKIQNLRDAAGDFVDTVIQPASSPSLTTVSIVPYNATVNLGSVLAPYYNLSAEHDYSRCAIFDAGDFSSLHISRSLLLERLAHFDRYSTWQQSTEINSPWCADDDYGSIMVHSSDAAALNAHIDSLGAGGNTAIDLGMKWGVALLEPQAQDLVTDMIADGHLAASATGRPAAYDDEEALKIVVLMTDGQNTTEYDLRPSLKSGPSPVWYYSPDGGTTEYFSVLVDDQPGTANDTWYWERFADGTMAEKYRDAPEGGAAATPMSYPQVYARWGVRAAALRFLQRPFLDGEITGAYYNEHYYGVRSIVGPGAADTRLSNICEAARNTGITVYAIGFEAPAAGLAAMQDCASSPSHYFAVEGAEISDVFQSIANTINELKLTN